MTFSLAVLSCRRCLSVWCQGGSVRPGQAERNPHRLGDLQSGLAGAEGQGFSRRNSPRTASRSAGCRAPAPTRRWNSATPVVDFGSTAGSAALVARINGNPIKSIYVYSRPEWTALVTGKNSNITRIEDLKGKRVAVTRGTDPHIFLVRALQSVKPHRQGHHAGPLQHADGKAALERGDVDAWAGLDPMMARQKSRTARSCLPQHRRQHLGHPQCARAVPEAHPELVQRVLKVYEDARKYSFANPDQVKKTFIAVTKLPEAVVDRAQRADRTDPFQDRRAATGTRSGGRHRAAAGR